MLESKHTFLFEEALWCVSGYYLDAHQNRSEVAGHIAVSHQDGLWLSRSSLTKQADDEPLYETENRITPFGHGSLSTRWSSDNSLVGPLTGNFVIVKDSILSLSISPDNDHMGTEYLLRVLAGEYISRGALFEQGKRLVSWSVELLRAS